MVLVELLTAGERPPRDQLVNVGPAGIVADVLAFDARPGRRRDDLARLGLHIAETDLLVLTGECQMRMLAAGELRQSFPGLHGNLAVGFRSEAQDHFAGIDVAFDPGHTLGHALVGDRAVQAPKEIDLVSGVPADALAAVAERLEQRPQ